MTQHPLLHSSFYWSLVARLLADVPSKKFRVRFRARPKNVWICYKIWSLQTDRSWRQHMNHHKHTLWRRCRTSFLPWRRRHPLKRHRLCSKWWRAARRSAVCGAQCRRAEGAAACPWGTCPPTSPACPVRQNIGMLAKIGWVKGTGNRTKTKLLLRFIMCCLQHFGYLWPF